MKALFLIAYIALTASGLAGQARQDTTMAKPDTARAKVASTDSLKQKPQPPAFKPAAKYQIDTSFEAVNLERYYYGMDGIDDSFYYNPWQEFLFQDADVREEDEKEQMDQERDSIE